MASRSRAAKAGPAWASSSRELRRTRLLRDPAAMGSNPARCPSAVLGWSPSASRRVASEGWWEPNPSGSAASPWTRASRGTPSLRSWRQMLRVVSCCGGGGTAASLLETDQEPTPPPRQEVSVTKRTDELVSLLLKQPDLFTQAPEFPLQPLILWVVNKTAESVSGAASSY